MTREELRKQVLSLFCLCNSGDAQPYDCKAPDCPCSRSTDAAIALVRRETLEEAAREIERQLYVERHPLAQAIRALGKEGK